MFNKTLRAYPVRAMAMVSDQQSFLLGLRPTSDKVIAHCWQEWNCYTVLPRLLNGESDVLFKSKLSPTKLTSTENIETYPICRVWCTTVSKNSRTTSIRRLLDISANPRFKNKNNLIMLIFSMAIYRRKFCIWCFVRCLINKTDTKVCHGLAVV